MSTKQINTKLINTKPINNKTATPFHDAETAVQARFGLAEALAERYQDFIRPYMPNQHREFYASLPMMIVGLTDSDGNVWASPLFGKEGFVQTPSETELSIHAPIPLATVVDLNMQAKSKIALLGIELGTRRRNRVNGVIQSHDLDESRVKQTAQAGFEKSDSITENMKATLEKADTFFIASRTKTFSQDPRSGIDASHRGGTSGFVKVNGNTLLFPDFSGNKFFNTIGNIQDDGRVGLCFPNFENSDAIFISGKARVLWDEQLLSQYEGAERFIEVDCEQIINAKGFMPANGQLTQASPSFSGKERWQV